MSDVAIGIIGGSGLYEMDAAVYAERSEASPEQQRRLEGLARLLPRSLAALGIKWEQ